MNVVVSAISICLWVVFLAFASVLLSACGDKTEITTENTNTVINCQQEIIVSGATLEEIPAIGEIISIDNQPYFVDDVLKISTGKDRIEASLCLNP